MVAASVSHTEEKGSIPLPPTNGSMVKWDDVALSMQNPEFNSRWGRNAGVAQWSERLLYNRRVAGSNPVAGTMNR